MPAASATVRLAAMAASSVPASAGLPRRWKERLGYERSKALFDLAEDAKKHLLDFASTHDIDIEYVEGQLNVCPQATA